MNVICSDGKGELTTEQCLECALKSPKHHPPCGFDHGFLKSLFDTEDRSEEIHVTDILGCLKRSYLGKVDRKPVHVHELIVLAMGRAVHSLVEKSDEVASSEMSLEYEFLVGTSDRVYKDGRVVDYKSTRWLMPDKLPYGKDEAQVNVYGFMLRRMGFPVTSLAIQYIDMSGPTKCRACKRTVRMYDTLRCPNCMKEVKNAHLGAVLYEVDMWNESELEWYIRDNMAKLSKALTDKIAPEATVGYLCGYCAHSDECLEGQKYLEKEGKSD